MLIFKPVIDAKNSIAVVVLSKPPDVQNIPF